MDYQLIGNNTNKHFGDTQSIPKLLIFGYGNPGRGDDALGPMLVERIAELKLAQITCQYDMQLLVEHVTDLIGFDHVFFVDADMSCTAPYEFSSVVAEKDDSYTSHALTPAALLYIYLQIYGHEPPPTFILRIRGYNFELGDHLSNDAAVNLQAAFTQMKNKYLASENYPW